MDKDRHCDICGKFVDENGEHNITITNLSDLFDLEETKDLNMSYYENNLPLNGQEIDAIYNYATNKKSNPLSSPSINKYLRNIRNDYDPYYLDERVEEINKIDNAINKFKLNKDIHVYRAYGLPKEEGILHMEIYSFFLQENGITTYEDYGFLSTSTHKKGALAYFNSALKDNDVIVLLDIHVSKGTRCLPVQLNKNMVSNTKDFEVLFPRQTQIKVQNIIKFKYQNKYVYILRGRI